MKKLLLTLTVAAVLTGCAAVVKVGPGETIVANKLAVTVDSAWNQFAHNIGGGNATLWTVDGIAIDRMEFYVLKDGEALAPNASGAKDARPLNFKSAMQPHEIVALYQGLYSRDGSTFTLDKLEPAQFAGQPGFRFEYTIVRKKDDVKLAGVAWAAVRNNELYAMTYTAPRLSFFPRYVARVEQVAKSAKIKA